MQVVCGDLPLLVTELGLASELHGELSQAHSLDCQLREVDECGCAGATVFSWRDNRVVAGYPVEGWGFGLTRRDRSPKPALEGFAEWAERDLAGLRTRWPALTRFRVIMRPGRLVPPIAAAGALVGLARRLLDAAVLATAATAAVVEAVLLRHLMGQVVVRTSRGTR